MTPFPRASFLALVAGVVGCPPSYVTWKGTQEPAYMKPAPPLLWASLRIGASSRVTVGVDDLRRIDNGDGTFTVNQVGRRQIILGIDCFTWDSMAVHLADEILENLLADIYSPDNLDTLNGMALVVETNGPIFPLPTTIDAHMISAAHVDLTVALAFQDTARYPGGNQWIAEVVGSGLAADGTSLGSVDVVDGPYLVLDSVSGNVVRPGTLGSVTPGVVGAGLMSAGPF